VNQFIALSYSTNAENKNELLVVNKNVKIKNMKNKK